MIPWSTIPLPTVVATLRWNTNRATKLKNAAIATAWWGFSTPVDTTVAIEFAASWKPFMKSKASATKIRNTRTWNVMHRPNRQEGYGDVPSSWGREVTEG